MDNNNNYNNNDYNNNDYSSESNNQSVSVKLGALSTYLHSDCFETARLSCHFGALEVFFDDVVLSEHGAEVHCECGFGAIEIFVPRHWDVYNHINCSLGVVEFSKRFVVPKEGAPKLILTGNVILGCIEIRQV